MQSTVCGKFVFHFKHMLSLHYDFELNLNAACGLYGVVFVLMMCSTWHDVRMLGFRCSVHQINDVMVSLIRGRAHLYRCVPLCRYSFVLKLLLQRTDGLLEEQNTLPLFKTEEL